MTISATWLHRCPPRCHLKSRLPTPPKRFSRASSTMSRDYASALQKLNQLQSNRTVTHLFHGQSSQQLNAAAIPEMRQWLRRAGYTTEHLSRMRHIHVAGTKGKGSICAFATAMLRRAGVSVGTYTSPHLVSPRERIAINGEPITQEAFAEAFFELWDRFTRVGGEDGPKPFYFRYLTIMAWHVFLQRGIRDVVMECGIGGEHDATNVVPAEAVSAAVIARLGVDHVGMLGETVEEIAWHKAGVMKPGVVAFTMSDGRGRLASSTVVDVLRKRAREKGATLVEVDAAEVEAWGGVPGKLKGDHQVMNQALAVMAVRTHLGQKPTSLGELPDTIVRGLQEATLRGRCETLQVGQSTWLLDGAHTRESLEQTAAWMVQQIQPGQRVVLIFNQQERDAGMLLRAFVEAIGRGTGGARVSHALFTRNELRHEAERDMTVQESAAKAMRDMCPDCEVEIFDNIHDAVSRAETLGATTRSTVLVTGSFHLVGGVLQALEPDAAL